MSSVLGDGCHSNTDVIGAFCALKIQHDQQLFTMVYCCFYIKVNVFCSEIDTESKNVIGMIPLYTTQRDIINNVHCCLFPLFR